VSALFFLLPGESQAAVFVNEVAWMGSADSANHEWIELHNDGPATTVDGWTLSDGGGLSIELSGTIPGSSYAVLERTSDASAPGSAFFIYTGALNNSGVTLRLENSQGQLVDLVHGGEDWGQIGGDNATKETAQYTTSGWITAEATPGAANHTQSTTAPAESADEDADQAAAEAKGAQTTSTKSSGSVETVRLVLPDVTLELAIDAQSVGYVNQTIPFHSTASGIGDRLIDSLQYQWNFGDGTTTQSADTHHAFAFPGSYVVTLHGEYKRQKYIARHEITILPVALSITQNAAGDIQLNNDSPYEVDISGYTLQGRDHFVFPDYSIILPNQTITLPRRQLADHNPAMLTVTDTHNVQLASFVPKVTPRQLLSEATVAFAASDVRTVPSRPSVAPTAPAAPAPSPTASADRDPAPEQFASNPSPQPTASYQALAAQPAAAALAAPSTRTERLAYVGLAIVIFLALFTIYLQPRRNRLE
jgi:hypothetical protein